MLVMLYVPMAQIRQAATGDWQRFFQFRLVGAIICRRPLACLGVAICHVILSIPVSVLKTIPYFLAHLKPEIDAMTDAQLVQLLNSFYLRTGLLGFPCFAFSGFWRRASMPAAWCV